jgi:hypothetical protein
LEVGARGREREGEGGRGRERKGEGGGGREKEVSIRGYSVLY